MKSYKRFIIKGMYGSEDVQGVTLREEIRKLSKSFGEGIKGQVKNLKDGTVEIIAEIPTDSEAKQFWAHIENNLKKGKLFEIDWKNSGPQDKLFSFKDFDIIRESELQEMVWSLQGAGKLFKQQLKTFRRYQDDKKRAVLKGLHENLNELDDLATSIKAGKKREFNLFAVENFLKEIPPGTPDEFISVIRGLHSHCEDANNYIKELSHPKLKRRWKT